MPSWINKRFLERLATRFTLRVTKDLAGAFPMGSVILPITNIDDLLSEAAIVNETSPSGGVASYTVLTVPAGKRYKLHALTVVRVGGDHTISYWFLVDPTTNNITIGYFTAASSFYTGILNHPITLDQNWLVAVYASAGTVNSAWSGFGLITREDAF